MEFKYNVGDTVKAFLELPGRGLKSYTGTVRKRFESLIENPKYEIDIPELGAVTLYEDKIIAPYGEQQ